MTKRGKIDFEVLLDDSFVNIASDDKINPIDKKQVVSFVNDFADGKWRYNKFQHFIWDNIAETALTVGERKALIDKSQTQLIESAKNLRLTDKDPTGQGSELAEVVLYGIMKHFYGALPVVPKIFHKQNPQDNAKGADSVHIVLEGEDDFSLWLGEAKFYNSIEDDRLSAIIDSVEESLQTKKLQKENSLITNMPELAEFLVGKPILLEKIKSLLSNATSIDLIKPKLHIPILLLHECQITAKQNVLTEEYPQINFSINFLTGLENYFKMACIEGKQRIIGSIFPNRLIFEENKYRTTEINPIIWLLQREKSPKKEGKQVYCNLLSLRVVPPGLHKLRLFSFIFIQMM